VALVYSKVGNAKMQWFGKAKPNLLDLQNTGSSLKLTAKGVL
jgi:hypothetical protein